MMKKFLLVLLLLSGSFTLVQAQLLNYQGIARNANGVALSFQNIGIRLSIRDGSANGTTLYSETREVRTNQFGLITLVIGSPGAVSSFGNISTINWAASSKFLQVEIDPQGGNNFLLAGTSQLQSVPYAFFANAAYPVGNAGGDLIGSTYPNPVVAPLAITNSKLAADAVTNEKIKDATIENSKLVNSSIGLNGLPLSLGGGQSFAVGSTGTNVNIVSSGTVHSFNFPNASATNRGVLTAADWSSFNSKLSAGDTAAMLSKYLRATDTSFMMSRYLRKTDTATMLAPFVQYSDTSNQMSGYQRKNMALLIQDTATMLNNRLRISDTAYMLSNRLILTDTAYMLSNRLKISDTSTMLANRLRSSDTATMLGTKWSTTGNTLPTVGNTYFLGSSNNQPLRFKVNGTWAGELNYGATNTSYGVGAGQSNTTSANNSAFGYGAMNLTTSIGSDNTAIGQAALQLNISGDNNTAVGQNALNATTGSNNTAIGQAALRLNTNINNTAVGRAALENTTGTGNTGVGYLALQTNTSGDNNTAIGNGADLGSATGISNSTVIGNGAIVNTSNTIQLGNAAIVNVQTTGAINARGAILGFVEVTSAYTITGNDYYIKISGNVVVTLPTAVGRAGQRYVIFNASGVTYASLTTTLGQTITGITWSGNILSNATLVVFSDGSNWLVESN